MSPFLAPFVALAKTIAGLPSRASVIPSFNRELQGCSPVGAIAGRRRSMLRAGALLSVASAILAALPCRAGNPAPMGPDFPLFMYESGNPPASILAQSGWNILQDYSASSTAAINGFLPACAALGATGPAIIPEGGQDSSGYGYEMPVAQTQSWIQAVSGNSGLSWWNMPEELRSWSSGEMQMLKDYCSWTRLYDPQARPNYEVVEPFVGAGSFTTLAGYADVLGGEVYCEWAGQPHAWVRYQVHDAMVAGILQAGKTIGTNYQAGQVLPICVLQIAANGTSMPTPAQSYHDFWSAIASGAMGVSVFAYWHGIHDNPALVPCITQVNTAASQITGSEHLGDVILNGITDPNTSFSILSGPAQTVTFTGAGGPANMSYPSINTLCKVRNGNVYVIAVNSTDQPVTASINNLASAASSATVLFQSRSVALSGGSLTDTFPAWGVNIYKMPLNAGSAPVAPTALIATPASNSQVCLSWSASARATSYNLKRATSSGGPYSVVATGLTQATYTDFGLAAQTAYYYVVSAFNDYGESPNSPEATATTQTYNGTWTNTSGGSWNNSANWSGGVIATGAGQTADFSTLNLTADATVTVDAERTIGNLVFGDTTPTNNWNLNTGTAGPLILSVSTGTPTITVNNKTTTIGAVLAGSQGFTKAGAGTLALTGANLYSGTATASAGTLTVSGNQTGATGGWSISPGATVNFLAGSNIAVAAGRSVGFQNSDTGHTLNVAGTVTNAGSLSMSAGSNLNLNSGANWTQGGVMTLQPVTAYASAQLTVNAGSTFAYTGSSTISLSASSGGDSGSASLNISGGTFSTGAGFNNGTSTGTGAANLNLSSGGILSLSANIPTLAATAGRPFNVQVGAGGGIIDTNGFSTTLSMGITGSGSFTKRGAGSLTLSGASTYTGATSILAGTLAVNGSLGATAVTVANGATLDGAGSLSGAVTVQAGGTLTVDGGAIGTLTVNNSVSLSGVTQLGISKSDSTANSDQIAGMTSVTYGGTLTVTNLGGTLAVGDTFTLFSATSYGGSFSTINLPALGAGMYWNTANLPVNGSISIVGQTLTSITLTPASAGVASAGTQQFTATGYDQFGYVLVTPPSFAWSVAGAGSVDGTGFYTGSYGSGTDTVTASSGGVNANASVTVTNAAPTVTTAATAAPGIVTGTSTSLSVLGSDSDGGGEPNLTYAWSTAAMPAGAAAPTYSANGTNAAKNTTVTFSKAGAYTLTVAITDMGGLSATSSVNVTVNQSLATISVTPLTGTIGSHATQQYLAAGYDQFGAALTSQPSVTWSSTGLGSVNSSGLYTASYAAGSATVTATSNGVVGTAGVTITDSAPTVATAASAFPATTTGTTANLSVLGADSDGGGEANLTYTWTATAVPSGAVTPTYSANGTNAAKNTTVTFSTLGTYTFTVTIADLGGLTATSSVNVTVTNSASGVWTNAAGGSWTNGANWSGGVIGSGTDATTDFSTLDLTADATVTLDGARIIGNLVFGDATPSNNWILNTGSGGPLTLNVSSGTPTITVNNKTATINAVLAGTQGFIKAGAGTLALMGANLYSGTTTASAGTLAVSGDQSGATGGWAINAGATVNFQAGSNVAVASGKSITYQNSSASAHTLNVAGTVANSGTLALQALSNLNINSGGNWAQSGSMTLLPNNTYSSAVVTVNTGGSFTYTGSSAISISASSGGNSGSSTLNITGGTFSTRSGFNNATSTGTGAANLNLSSGGILSLSANIPTLAATAGRPFNVQVGTGGGIVDTNGFSTTLSMGITGSGSFTKRGAGILTLSGASTYTGATSILAGTLAVNGSLGATPVTVANGATLDGAGSLNGAVTVQAGGTLTAGGGTIGTLTVNNSVSLSGVTQLGISKSGSTASSDQIAGMTSVTYGGTLTVTNLGGTLAVGDTFTLFSAKSFAGSFSTINLPALGAGMYWNTANLSVSGSISVVGQTLTSITLTPANAGVASAGAQQFAATGYDQYGYAMVTPPSLTWSVAGAGSVDGTGFYTGSYGSGMGTVTASSGGVSAAASVTVTDAAPTVATAAMATPATVTGTTTNLSVLGADSDGGGEPNLTYTWSATVAPAGAGAPTYSANGTNAAKNTMVTFSKAGAYTLTVTVTDLGGQSATSSVNVTVNQILTTISVTPLTGSLGSHATQQYTATGYDQFGAALTTQPSVAWSSTGSGSINSSGLYTASYAAGSATVTATSNGVSGTANVTVSNATPTVASAASATPNPVTGKTSSLSVLGADSDGGGEPNLTYTWSATTVPSGTSAPVFSANGTNAAKNTTATFSTGGTYTFTATITDAGGLSVTSSVSVTVSQTLAQISVTPVTGTVSSHGTQQFTATGVDQFGAPLATQPSVGWSSTGLGSIDGSGLYTASYAAGSATVTATSNGVSGTAAVTITNAVPTVATAAAASPGAVTGTTTSLSVLGADSDGGGESNLTYTWAATVTPSGAANPTFSVNGTNAAKNTTATFSGAGSYTLTVTIADAGGLSVTSSVNVTVNQTLTALTVSPSVANLTTGQTQQFSASANDQFGAAMTAAPTYTWAVTSGTGAITGSGLYTAPMTGTTDTVTVSSGSLQATATVNVTAGMLDEWKFDEGTGTTAADSGVGNHPGTVNGATWTAGPSSAALAFNGTGNTVAFGTAPALSGVTDFTVSAWIKTIAKTNGVIIQQRDATGFNGEYQLYVTSSGTVSFWVYGNSAYQFPSNITTTTKVNDGQWHQVAAVRQGATGQVYIDGVLAASATGTVRSLSSAISVTVGADVRDYVNYFNGAIDDVRIYNVALTAAQIGTPASTAGTTNAAPTTSTVPPGWSSADIGQVGTAGWANTSGGTFTVNGSGAGIGGTADAFQYSSQTLTGDGEVRAQVTSPGSANTVAGVMIRSDHSSGSVNALVALAGDSIVFQTRSANKGATTQQGSIPCYSGANNWVRLTVSGSIVTAYASPDGINWIQIGAPVSLSLPTSAFAGLAVTSGAAGTLATATFNNVSVTPFPQPWQSLDIGLAGTTGRSEYFNGAYTLVGAGNMGGTADSFHYTCQTLSGDGLLIARVSAGSGGFAGVMIRDGLSSMSMYAAIGVAGGAYTWQYRTSTGGATSVVAGGNATSPGWIKVQRSGNTLTGYTSPDGLAWTLVAAESITMGHNICIGLVEDSGSTTTLSASVFDNVSVVR